MTQSGGTIEERLRESLGEGLERSLKNKLRRTGLELLGYQLKEDQRKEQETRAPDLSKKEWRNQVHF